MDPGEFKIARQNVRVRHRVYGVSRANVMDGCCFVDLVCDHWSVAVHVPALLNIRVTVFKPFAVFSIIFISTFNKSVSIASVILLTISTVRRRNVIRWLDLGAIKSTLFRRLVDRGFIPCSWFILRRRRLTSAGFVRGSCGNSIICGRGSLDISAVSSVNNLKRKLHEQPAAVSMIGRAIVVIQYYVIRDVRYKCVWVCVRPRVWGARVLKHLIT